MAGQCQPIPPFPRIRDRNVTREPPLDAVRHDPIATLSSDGFLGAIGDAIGDVADGIVDLVDTFGSGLGAWSQVLGERGAAVIGAAIRLFALGPAVVAVGAVAGIAAGAVEGFLGGIF